MKKKLLSALLCVAMVASLVVGCGGTTDSPAENTAAEDAVADAINLPDGEYEVLDVRESYALSVGGSIHKELYISTLLANDSGERFQIHCVANYAMLKKMESVEGTEELTELGYTLKEEMLFKQLALLVPGDKIVVEGGFLERL